AEPLPGTAISLSDEERRRLFQALLRGEVSHHGSSLYGEIGDVVRNGLVTISGLHLARYLGTGVSSLTSRGSGRSVPSRTGEAAVPRLIVRSLLAATVILMLVASSAEAGNHGGHGHRQARHHVLIVCGGGGWV